MFSSPQIKAYPADSLSSLSPRLKPVYISAWSANWSDQAASGSSLYLRRSQEDALRTNAEAYVREQVYRCLRARQRL